MAAQAGLSLACVETPEGTFCRVVPHIILIKSSLMGFTERQKLLLLMVRWRHKRRPHFTDLHMFCQKIICNFENK